MTPENLHRVESKIHTGFKTDSELQGEYDAEKRRVLETLTDNILSSILTFGNVSRICEYPAVILRPLVETKYRDRIAGEVGFNPKRVEYKSPEINNKAGEFLKRAVERIFKDRSSPGNYDPKKDLTYEMQQRGFGWKKIELMLDKHWSAAGLKKEQKEKLRQAEAQRILDYASGHLKDDVCQKCRALKISSPTFGRYMKEFKLINGVATRIDRVKPNEKNEVLSDNDEEIKSQRSETETAAVNLEMDIIAEILTYTAGKVPRDRIIQMLKTTRKIKTNLNKIASIQKTWEIKNGRPTPKLKE